MGQLRSGRGSRSMLWSRDEWEREYALTRLFIAKQLGPRPRRFGDRALAIAHASDVLDGLDSEEAAHARRFLAIEYEALRARPHLAATDWEAAVAAVAAATDAEVRRMARGGMVLRAEDPGAWDASVD